MVAPTWSGPGAALRGAVLPPVELSLPRGRRDGTGRRGGAGRGGAGPHLASDGAWGDGTGSVGCGKNGEHREPGAPGTWFWDYLSMGRAGSIPGHEGAGHGRDVLRQQPLRLPGALLGRGRGRG